MKYFIAIFLYLIVFAALGQKKEYNLVQLHKANKVSIYNRAVSLSAEKPGALKLDEKSGGGLVWLNDVSFTDGAIEIDLRGKDVLQQSFLGIAFHGVDDSNYEAIYFRPFNFHAKDSIRKIHAVQYIYHPIYSWDKLRDERNGVFEKALINPPDPNGWFHARIVVSGENVSVYVNDDKAPSLVVKRLSEAKSGKVGLWVGEGSGGEFANLAIAK